MFLSVIALHTSLHLPLQSPVSVQSALLAVPPSARCSSPPVDLSVALTLTSLRMWPHPIEWRGRSLALTVTFVLVGLVSMDTLLGQITGNCFSEAAMQGPLSRSTSRSSKDSTVSPLFGSLLYAGWRQRDQASWGRCHSPGAIRTLWHHRGLVVRSACSAPTVSRFVKIEQGRKRSEGWSSIPDWRDTLEHKQWIQTLFPNSVGYWFSFIWFNLGRFSRIHGT